MPFCPLFVQRMFGCRSNVASVQDVGPLTPRSRPVHRLGWTSQTGCTQAAARKYRSRYRNWYSVHAQTRPGPAFYYRLRFETGPSSCLLSKSQNASIQKALHNTPCEVAHRKMRIHGGARPTHVLGLAQRSGPCPPHSPPLLCQVRPKVADLQLLASVAAKRGQGRLGAGELGKGGGLSGTHNMRLLPRVQRNASRLP